VDGFGGVGARHAAARLARKRSERWVTKLVCDVRADRQQAPAGSALEVVAWHRELDGKLLEEHTAALELLNIARPTVACARPAVRRWTRAVTPAFPRGSDVRVRSRPSL
jgi:fatty-acid peroxygenase